LDVNLFPIRNPWSRIAQAVVPQPAEIFLGGELL